jgi:hypothetical protein
LKSIQSGLPADRIGTRVKNELLGYSGSTTDDFFIVALHHGQLQLLGFDSYSQSIILSLQAHNQDQQKHGQEISRAWERKRETVCFPCSVSFPLMSSILELTRLFYLFVSLSCTLSRMQSGAQHNTGYKSRKNSNRLGRSTEIKNTKMEKKVKICLGIL